MKKTLLVIAVLLVSFSASAREKGITRPFETKKPFVAKNAIDQAVLKVLKKKRIKPANICTDAVFIRRVYVDVIGTIPRPQEVVDFLKDRRADKRARLIETLLQRSEFADYWALKWSDLLRVKAEFPINLWPNAVQAYYRWLHDAIRTNRPYDDMAREMLTATGSNFRVPAVNFCRATPSREPSALAQLVAMVFMGSRFDAWPEDRRNGMAAFFSRLSFKRTVEWKEVIVTKNPAPAGPLEAVFPDGTQVTISPELDPRRIFADWLLAPSNPWFAKTAVNRVWTWLMGRGIIHEPDDIRPDNPPSNPALLACLEKELVLSDFDLRHIYRLILNSATYQQSSVARSKHAQAEALFAHAIVRRMDAEVLIDALCWITGSTEKYESPIPEPFTFLPEDERTIELQDGSITSPFLEMFGRPARDSGLWSERNNGATAGQRLYLLNSSNIQRRIERSPVLALAIRKAGRDAGRVISSMYLIILSRLPTEAELTVAKTYARTSRVNAKQAVDDLVWALINSKEFLYRH
jgi:Protein of unknown function (DUF1553)/Protein of unknown function (DUF1549)